MEPNICSQCRKSNQLWEDCMCPVCSYLFCIHCFDMHNKAMTEIRLQPSEKICKTHNEELNLFCTEKCCDVIICCSCAIGDHKGHAILPSTAQANKYLASLQQLKQKNEEKLKEVSFIISRLNKKKANFENEVQQMQLVLENRRDNIAILINELFQEQSNSLSANRDAVMNEFNEEIKNLENIERDLRKVAQSYSHVSRDVSYYKILDFYKSQKHYIKVDLENPLVEFTTVGLIPVSFQRDQIQETMTSLFGKIHLFVNERVLRKIEDEYLNPVLFETKNELVHDICYDAEQKNLFAIVSSRSKNSILKFHKAKMVHAFNYKNDCDHRLSAYMTLLPNRSILILSAKRMQILSNDMARWESLPTPLQDLDNVSAICTSPCLTWTYVYNNNIIYKYNPLKSALWQNRLPLPDEFNKMTVHENLDFIACFGIFLKGICLCSFSQGVILCTIGNDSCVYFTGCFLSKNCLLVYNRKYYSLEALNISGNQTVRCIGNSQKGKKYFHSMHVITKCSKNTLFVCEWNDDNNSISKMILKL